MVKFAVCLSILFLAAVSLIPGCTEPDSGTPPQDSCRVSEVLDPEIQPKINFRAIPAYPMEAMRDSLSGEAKVVVWIGPDSLVCETEIVDWEGCECFGEASELAAQLSHYSAGQKDGVPVVCRIELEYSFVLGRKAW